MAKKGRPAILTPKNRDRILRAVSVGLSFRDCARLVGCSPSAISKASKSDPDFFNALKAAEMEGKMFHLEIIREAAKKHWQASAWFLERKYPGEYGQRKEKPVVNVTLPPTPEYQTVAERTVRDGG